MVKRTRLIPREQGISGTARAEPSLDAVARLIDFKISEQVRLGRLSPGGLSLALPVSMSPFCTPPGTLLAALATLFAFRDESDKVVAKIAPLLAELDPPAGEPDMPVEPPKPLTPEERKYKDALEKARRAAQDAKNDVDELDPESAREKLRKAKAALRDKDVRKEFRKRGKASAWYDLLKEIQDMIAYLDEILQ